MKKNCYDILRIRQTATAEQITAAYKTRVDECQALLDEGADIGNELTMVRECHAVLTDPAKRDRYDDRLALEKFTPTPTAPTAPQVKTTVDRPNLPSEQAQARDEKLMPCPTCGQQISRTAKACPHCGDDLGKAAHSSHVGNIPTAANQGIGCVSMTAVAIIVLLIVGVFFGRGTSTPSARDLEIDAFIMCRQYVEQALKAPATADFPATRGVLISENTYGIRAYVDAQNSFGAKIRTHYTCTVRHLGGDRWELVSFKM